MSCNTYTAFRFVSKQRKFNNANSMNTNKIP